MSSLGEGGRKRFVALFATLLLASSAAPVLAEEAPPPPPVPSEAEQARLPDSQEIQEGIEAAASEEADREAELEGPAAAEEREESRDAFADADAAQAKELLSALFSEQLAALNSDPARFLSDAQLVQVLDEDVATVRDEGDSSLLDAAIPLRAEDEAGELRKVDLSLEPTAEGFEPTNPLTEVSIPSGAGGAIAVGEEGVSVSQVGVEASGGQPFGEVNVFYPDVLTDTDLLVSPIAAGVEVFNQLRSEQSPEELRFALAVPEGAELRETEATGGAEVAEGERLITRIPPPTAVDAQGSDVPVQMSVEGDSLVLSVPHREADLAYPILVDPVYEDHQNWVYGQNHWALTGGGWWFNTNTAGKITGSTYCIAGCFGLPQGTRGLYVSAQSGSYSAGRFASWSTSAPNANSYISRVTLMPYWREVYGCGQDEPYDYFGVWSNASNDWAYRSVGSANYGGGSYTIFHSGDAVVFGLGTGASSISLPCTRDLYAGGAHMWLDDWGPPSVSSVTDPPTKWIKATDPVKVVAQASDAGLGVQNVAINTQGGGTILHVPEQSQCRGTRNSPCLNGHTATFNLTGNHFREGRRVASVTSYDPTGKYSNAYHFETKVDGTAPKVALSGQLAEATEEVGSQEPQDTDAEKLRLPVYNLQVEATDGSSASEIDTRSGVKDVEVYLDGVRMSVPWLPQSCPAGSCSMAVTYQLRLSGIATTGLHKLKVLVRDQVDNVEQRTIEFEYFPATGMKEEYLLHYFPLPDGQGDEGSEEHPDRPELAVNVATGNLVYREQDVEVEGAALDLEVERYYNSMLPDSENTEWGDGWTLAQTPELEPQIDDPGAGAPTRATLLEQSGAVQYGVTLPSTVGAQSFDPDLQATVTREPDDQFEIADETGETDEALLYDASGRVAELRTSGYAKIDYDYEAGVLAEIAVEDPGSSDGGPAQGGGGSPPVGGPPTDVIYAESAGSPGQGNGQLASPADVAVDSAGNLLVLDRGNSRVQRLSPEGEYLSQFGGYGSGNGQLKSPSALAIDSENNVLVVDTGNNRVQKFSPQGAYLSQFGSFGTGNGQFSGPSGIAIAPGGSIFVSDRGNHRVQRFTKAGVYYGQTGSYGWEDQHFDEPTALAIGGPLGEFAYTVFVADAGNNRVKRHTPFGVFVSKFGTGGTAPGQFDSPTALDAEGAGYLWVGDRRNNRLQLFTQTGTYVDQAGSTGTGEEQLNLGYPMGIATDGAGGVWVTDTGNGRLQKWVAGNYVPSETPLPPDDPEVEIESEGGLVTSLAGEEAGEHTYERQADLLTAHDGPEGETQYQYDSAKRLTKVTLPNGTWGEIEYFATDGRVKKVTVAPAGASQKTTHFLYSDQPRRTVVTPPDAPQITYDIGPDGSVFKSWHTLSPPKLTLLGTLYANRETAGPISIGDYYLTANANSPHSISSIQVVVNGDTLVDETTCEENLETQQAECEYQLNEWVTETGAHPPGILKVEVIATDRFGRTTSERFWVNVPYTPPPPPGAPVPPKFNDIKQFREEYGLEVIFPVANEIELNERIFDLIGAWRNPSSPEGQVARASMDRWGVPLRPEDVAEMEYREQYIELNGPKIDSWGEASYPNSYAGYYVDHRAGGRIRVGLTGDQAPVQSLASPGGGLMAWDRVAPFPAIPTKSRVSLAGAESQILNAANGSEAWNDLTDIGLDDRTNTVLVGSKNVAQTQSLITQLLGPGAPVTMISRPYGIEPAAGRNRRSGRLLAGDRLFNIPHEEECTANFGAFETRNQKSNGEDINAKFLLTAGHCFPIDTEVTRADNQAAIEPVRVGQVTRSGYRAGTYRTDAEAIRLKGGPPPPLHIYRRGDSPLPVGQATPAQKENRLCTSGVRTDVKQCGKVLRRYTVHLKHFNVKTYEVALFVQTGDSGAPVWNPRTGAAIGIVSYLDESRPGVAWVTPLQPIPDVEPAGSAPGALRADGMYHLNLLTSD